MALDPELIRLADNVRGSAARVASAQFDDGKRFQAGFDYVYWGEAADQPQELLARDHVQLFKCDDPVGVAAQLDVIVEAALDARKAADLTKAQAEYDRDEAELKVYNPATKA